MSPQQMLLITKTRVEFHPDFSATLIAKWRAGQSLLNNRQEIAWRARIFNDDGLEIPEAVEAAEQQIFTEVVLSVCAQIWTEYRIASSLKSKTEGKPKPPSSPPAPSL